MNPLSPYLNVDPRYLVQVRLRFYCFGPFFLEKFKYLMLTETMTCFYRHSSHLFFTTNPRNHLIFFNGLFFKTCYIAGSCLKKKKEKKSLRTPCKYYIVRYTQLCFHYYPFRIQMSLFYLLELIKPVADLN
jgi:hypothetical protein